MKTITRYRYFFSELFHICKYTLIGIQNPLQYFTLTVIIFHELKIFRNNNSLGFLNFNFNVNLHFYNINQDNIRVFSMSVSSFPDIK